MAIVKGVRIDFPYVKVTAAPSGGGSIVASTDTGWVDGTGRGDRSARYGTWIITESAMGAVKAEAAAVVESLVEQGYRVVDHRPPDWVLEQATRARPRSTTSRTASASSSRPRRGSADGSSAG